MRELRVWPGVAIATVQGLAWFLVPDVVPDVDIGSTSLGMISLAVGVLGGLFVAIWWLFFSRAPWADRICAPIVLIAAIWLLRPLIHVSILGANMGYMLPLYSVPIVSLGLVAWAVVTRRMADRPRRLALLVAAVLVSTPWLLVRTAGTLSTGSDLHWRWTPTPEDLLLAQTIDEPPPVAEPVAEATPAPAPEAAPAAAPPTPAAPATAAPVPEPPPVPAPEPAVVAAEWPGFRGPHRDGVANALRISTDWAATPPVEIWRRAVGPGWSSFAVQGDVIYTQEQRGESEMVSSYRLSTGAPVWFHRDSIRFWESNAGAGPRATPTIAGRRVFAFGATGRLNALDAPTGKRLWSRDVAAETGRKVPIWGFSSSPLVVDDIVVVAASGTLAAYDARTGAPRWKGPSYGGSYSSPHLATFDGMRQIVLLGGPGAYSVAPSDGAVLWEHKWESGAIVQPALTADGDILVNALASTGGTGTRRLAITHTGGTWGVTERWTSIGLKPYFNDFVIHKGHAYGFDGAILACIDLADGARKWKGGRYGNGQLVLLPDDDALLVLSEEGEVALVSATTGGFKELARMPALNAKTWNHPVVVGDVLLVRNGEEMAAYRLPVNNSQAPTPNSQ